MNFTKILLAAMLLVIQFQVSLAQHGINGCYGFDCREKKWSVSLFNGMSLLGPGSDISAQMIKAGFGKTKTSSSGGAISNGAPGYLQTGFGIAWNVEIRDNISGKTAFAFTAGRSDHKSLTGTSNNGEENSINMKSDIWNASLNLILKIGERKDRLSMGPVVATHLMRYTYSTESTIHSSKFRTSLNLAYEFSVVENDRFFLALKANYVWMPNAETGSFSESNDHTQGSGEKEAFSTVMNKTAVRLSTVNFGISTGIKF